MLAQSLLILGVVFRLRCWNSARLSVFLSVFGECAKKGWSLTCDLPTACLYCCMPLILLRPSTLPHVTDFNISDYVCVGGIFCVWCGS
jgi:hypothetical protein